MAEGAGTFTKMMEMHRNQRDEPEVPPRPPEENSPPVVEFKSVHIQGLRQASLIVLSDPSDQRVQQVRRRRQLRIEGRLSLQLLENRSRNAILLLGRQ